MGHFVEQLVCGCKKAGFGIHVEERGEDMRVKWNTQFEEVGMESEAVFGGWEGSAGGKQEGEGVLIEGAGAVAHLGV